MSFLNKLERSEIKEEHNKDDIILCPKTPEKINPEINTIKLENEKELKRIEISKNLYARILEYNGEKVIDFCKFYKGFPTKKNIRINLNNYKKLNELLFN